MRTRRLVALAAAIAVALTFSCVPAVAPEARSSAKTFERIVFMAEHNEALAGFDYGLAWNGSAWRNDAAMPCGTSLSSLVATFDVSDGAVVTVNGVIQRSGVTANDYADGITYTITAADGSSMDHPVTLKREATPPSYGGIGLDGLTVVSYNAEDFQQGSVETHTSVARMLKNASADIVVLTETEVSIVAGVESDLSRLQAALAAIGYPMQYSASVEVGYPDDIAILSRYEIGTSGTVASPNTRPGVKAVVRVPNGDAYTEILVIGLHLKASYSSDTTTENEEKRIAQAAALADTLRSTYAERVSSGYVIIAGDMNTWKPLDRNPAASCTLGRLCLLDDASPSNDFTAVNEQYLPATSTHQLGSVLDHIILSPALFAHYRPDSVQVKTADSSVTMSALSDHYPVLLELDL